jgi:rod shape-determining protein MreC
MYGKTVRRRRMVLALLVVLSIILLTAYFGESSSGGLHSVQRGFMTVVSPIQDGANAVLKPVRSAVGWFGGMLKAKDEASKLRSELAQLRKSVVAERSAHRTIEERRQIAEVESHTQLAGYRRVDAEVLLASASIWYETIGIDKGSSEGVAVNDPVINGEGLVGKVTAVAPEAAQVSLITDSAVKVSARVAGSRQAGILQPKVGNPSDLLLQYLSGKSKAAEGDLVETSGTVESPYESIFPAGIPIGTVTSIESESSYAVNVRPAVELHGLDHVQVLTNGPGSRSNRAAGLASLPGASGSEGSAPETGVAQVEGG